MSKHTEELAQRRMALQQRCAQQRNELGELADNLQHGLRHIDRGLTVLARFRSAPVVFLAAVIALAYLGPSGMWRWTGRLLLVGGLLKKAANLTRILDGDKDRASLA
jgi:hypothetical protein